MQRRKGASQHVRVTRLVNTLNTEHSSSSMVSTILPQKRRREEHDAAKERVRLMLSGIYLFFYVLMSGDTKLFVGLSNKDAQVLQDRDPAPDHHGQDGPMIHDINADEDADYNLWQDLPKEERPDDPVIHALQDLADSRYVVLYTLPLLR